MRWCWSSYEREKSSGKKTRSSALTAGKLSGGKKCWPSLLFCCLWIFQELLQPSLSWPKMFAHSWSGLQVRDSFFLPFQGSKGRLPFTKNLRKLRWKVPSGEERVQFYIHFSLSLFKIQDGGADIALNCLDLANPSENLKVELVFPLEKFSAGELDKEPDKKRENRTKNRHEIGQKNQTRNQTKNWANNQTRNREKTRTRNRRKTPTEIQPKKSGTKKKWTKKRAKKRVVQYTLFSWTHNKLALRLTSDIFRKNVIFLKPD